MERKLACPLNVCEACRKHRVSSSREGREIHTGLVGYVEAVEGARDLLGKGVDAVCRLHTAGIGLHKAQHPSLGEALERHVEVERRAERERQVLVWPEYSVVGGAGAGGCEGQRAGIERLPRARSGPAAVDGDVTVCQPRGGANQHRVRAISHDSKNSVAGRARPVLWFIY